MKLFFFFFGFFPGRHLAHRPSHLLPASTLCMPLLATFIIVLHKEPSRWSASGLERRFRSWNTCAIEAQLGSPEPRFPQVWWARQPTYHSSLESRAHDPRLSLLSELLSSGCDWEKVLPIKSWKSDPSWLIISPPTQGLNMSTHAYTHTHGIFIDACTHYIFMCENGGQRKNKQKKKGPSMVPSHRDSTSRGKY